MKCYKFSIIVILYNQGKFISECLDSLIRQTYPCHEIIVIDDGSTDGGDRIVKDYIHRKQGNIKLFRQENRGAFVARAAGMIHAAGQYMIVMDADDCLRKDALEIINKELNQTEWDIVFYNASRETTMKKKFYNFPGEMRGQGRKIDKDVLKSLLCNSHMLNTMWGKCINTSLIDKEEIFKYGEGIPNGQDKVHSLYFIDKAECMTLIDENLYYYRINDNSRTHKYSADGYPNAKRLMDIMLMYAQKWYGTSLAEEMCRQHFADICYSWAVFSLELNKNWKDAKRCVETIVDDPVFEKYIHYYVPPKHRGRLYHNLKNKNMAALRWSYIGLRLEINVKRMVRRCMK